VSQPVLIEVALNGGTKKSRNPNTPVTPEEITADALACITAGAQVVHTHIEDFKLNGTASAQRYLAAWRPIHEAAPDVMLYPTVAGGETIEQRQSHAEALAESGLLGFNALDPGSVNFAGPGVGEGGMPGPKSTVYSHSYKDCEYILDQADRHRLPLNISIFDASFLRAVLAFQRAGRMRHGALVKLYFGGEYGLFDGTPGALTFGFSPTRKALEAYLEMLEGSGLAWLVNVYGGDLGASPMAQMALELGGHLRVGLEDYAGERTPSNLELVEKAVELAQKAGRRIATAREARAIIEALGRPV
jgi:uncharacterized protein (DUF849 family)